MRKLTESTGDEFELKVDINNYNNINKYNNNNKEYRRLSTLKIDEVSLRGDYSKVIIIIIIIINVIINLILFLLL